MVMIQQQHGWLGSRLKIIYINIFGNLYGKNEWVFNLWHHKMAATAMPCYKRTWQHCFPLLFLLLLLSAGQQHSTVHPPGRCTQPAVLHNLPSLTNLIWGGKVMASIAVATLQVLSGQEVRQTYCRLM